MRKRRAGSSIVANPVLVGAVTLLVVVVAVFLSYNANQGLPFVPTQQLKVRVPNAFKLVKGNEVREGGFRIGAVSEINPARMPDGSTGAELVLKIDKVAAPLPVDTKASIRPKSTLGLKFVEITRGTSEKQLADGASIRVGQAALSPEFEDFFAMFKPETRRDIRVNLTEFANAFAGRGEDLNRTFANLPGLLKSLEPVMRNLSDPKTGLARFISELEDGARVAAPVADQFAQGFADAADTFEALSRDEQALRDTIAKSPATLDVATDSLRAQRPFLRNFALVSTELRGTASEIRRSVPVINRALDAGIDVLPRTTRLNADLRDSLANLRDFSNAPFTNPGLRALTATVTTLNPTVRYAGPFVTVCNYWNSWWTNLSDHLSQQDETGTIQRIQQKNAPAQTNGLSSFGAPGYANGEGADPLSVAANGDPVFLHTQNYGRAVNDQGNADCETGQRGYPRRLAVNAPAGLQVATDARTPGDQGTTFTGRKRVPEGETFTAEPETGYKP
jgi:virulence factor Mce-like protein